jgi:hypothetical protein
MTHLSTGTPRILLELIFELNIVPPLLDIAFVTPIYLLARTLTLARTPSSMRATPKVQYLTANYSGVFVLVCR